VGDIAAHVTGVMADLTAGQVEGVGTQEWYDRQLAERRGRPAAIIAGELAEVIEPTRVLMGSFAQEDWQGPALPGIEGTLGMSVHSLWCGIYLHGEDILAALGRPAQRGPGLPAAVRHIADVWELRQWGPATLALVGLGDIDIAGGGRRIGGDPLDFVLAATGRADPDAFGLAKHVNIYT
jgi:hypothetical protein